MKHLIPFILLLIIGCKSQAPSIPSNIIKPDKMKSILVEMHFADAIAESKGQGGMNEKLLTQGYYDRIYQNYGVSRAEFLKSYHFYEGNPVLMNQMYEDVLGEMSKREANVGK